MVLDALDHPGPVLLRRASLALAALGLLLAVWPVYADAIRYELELRTGAQPVAQLEVRWADPEQNRFLARRPLCGPPVLAPLTYMQDSALRQGCAGPNARSMSLAVLLLGAAALTGAGLRPRRTRAARQGV